SALSARLNFLAESAHLVHFSTPETSAHLLRQRGNLASKHDITPSDVENQHVCLSCGNILVPGRESLLKVESCGTVRRKNAGKPKAEASIQAEPRGTSKVTTCRKCGRFTKIRFPAPGPVERRSSSQRSHGASNSIEAQKASGSSASK